MYYNWHRYYNPTTGRYITSDPIGMDGGVNTFLYAAGNPLRYINPLGLNLAAGAQGGTIAGGSIGGPIGAAVGGWLFYACGFEVGRVQCARYF